MRRRVGQLGLIIATALAVTGLFVFHGTAIADPSYSLSDPGRAAAAAAWSIGLLFVAYMAGLPDAVRTMRHAVGASFAAPAATVAVASLVQLAAGDALLPRFVVFASVLVMPVVNLMVTLPLVASRGRGVSTALVLASADQLADMARVTERGLPTMIATLLLLDPATQATLDTETLLMFAARCEHVHTVIRPALAQGRWVLSDRFTDATFAFQGGGRGVDPARIAVLEHWVQQGLQPDLTLLFDAPIDVAHARMAGARELDRFEQEAQAFHQRVRDAYLARAAADPQRVVVIRADQPLEQVRADALAALAQLLARKGCA